MKRYKDQRLKAASVKLVNSASVIVAADQAHQTTVASSNSIVVVCFGGRLSFRTVRSRSQWKRGRLRTRIFVVAVKAVR
jgi:hypothetical protein